MPSIKGRTYDTLAAITTQYVKYNPQYPYKTGNLRENATYYRATEKGFEIIFDEEKAPYIPYLELGVPSNFRYTSSGKVYYHGGSTKHVGFISQKSYKVVQDVLCFILNGKVDTINLSQEFSIGIRGNVNVSR